MGWRWRKSVRIFPGFRINLSHRGGRGQIGSSPLSFSFRLFGGSREKRVTASLPGTGLSWVGLMHSPPPSPVKPEKPAPDYQAAMREAFAQAAQLRLVPIQLEAIAAESPHIRREIVADAIPIFVKIMAANGVDRDAAKFGAQSLPHLSDEEFDLLIEEVTGHAPAPKRPPRYARARGAIARVG
jgi:hypothetical protein